MQFAWTNVPHGRKASVKNVIDAFEAAGLLYGHQAVRFFNNTNYGVVAYWRRAKATRINFSEVVADRAKNDSLLYVSECGNKSLEIRIRRTHKVKGEPLRGLLANARQTF
jgi:hypothetical protein